MQETWMKRLERLPVPILPTMVGAATLSNVYSGLGFSWIRHITMWLSTIIVLLYFIKIFRYPSVCKKEYSNTVPASLYAGLTMIIMILGSYFYEFSPMFGKGLWMAGLAVHILHILVFTYRNVIKARSIDTFVPSWFVTYNGVMVSCVVGGIMNERSLLTPIVYYGIAIYFILIILLIWRIAKFEIKDGVIHTLAVVLAPCSLCLASYLNIIEQPNTTLVYLLYACVVLSLLFVLYKLPKFFSYPFAPGFAGLTFPMAIGIVASTKMSGFLEQNGAETMAFAVKQISGIQIYVTTAIIGFVLFNFFKMFRGTSKG